MTTPIHYHEGRFPPENLDWAALSPLIGPAHAELGRYDGMLAAVPNANILIAPLTTQEAVLSSRIEGTQATLGEVYQHEAGQPPDTPERREDIDEIINYRSAMRKAEELLEELPLSQRVMRETHAVLLSGVRGRDKTPGEYRRIPNWIGQPGSTIEDAKFVPVGADRLAEALGKWEHYIHEDAHDLLIQTAVIHAEFEAMHPFLDGNGRLGRMLVPLFLWQRGLIRRPTFYISAYFERNRDEYYERLLAVSRDDDWTGWCAFFLKAVRTQAEENLSKTKGILDLYESMKTPVREATISSYAIDALDWIFQNPVFSSSHFAANSGIPASTARRVLRGLIEGEILKTLIPARGRRPAILLFSDVLNIAEGNEVF